MKIKILVVAVILLLLFNIFSINTFGKSEVGKYSESISDARVSNKNPNSEANTFSAAPKHFTENRGQLENDEVRFYNQGGAVWFTDSGVWFDIREYTESRGRGSQLRGLGGISGLDFDPMDRMCPPETLEYKRVILHQEFIDANSIQPVGRQKLAHYSNFFYGNDQSKWRSYVPNYAEIYYKNLYDGIDLRYYTGDTGLKYDFIVHPGADPNQIQIRYHGADELQVDKSGDLIISSAGKQLVDRDLFIYQDKPEARTQVHGQFILYNELEYGFQINTEFDKNVPLIIDPTLTLEYSTYFGGVMNDYGSSIAVDSLGRAVITGYTDSFDFPTTSGAYDETKNVSTDGIVAKFNSDGSDLIFSTFLAGDDTEYIYDVEVDVMDNIYVCGYTMSDDFPKTQNANRTAYEGPREGFATKLNSIGTALIYSTYVGADWLDHVYAIEVDSQGYLYIAGETNSIALYTTPNAYQSTKNGFLEIFVCKLNISGDKIIYATYVGSDGDDLCTDIAIDSKGNAYVTGGTYDSDFPTTGNAYSPTFNGFYDGFVFKLNHNGSELLYSTFLGGSSRDEGIAITTDSNDLPIVTGHTRSVDFPNTTGAYDNDFNGGSGNGDIFVLKMNETGGDLEFSTYIGGSFGDTTREILIDSDNNIWITGGGSNDFPVTPDAFNSSPIGGILFKLSSDGSDLLYSTYIGGSGQNELWGLDFDSMGDIYITGQTTSTDFPNTTGAYNNTHSGMYDIFVMKFSIGKFFNISSVELLDNEKTITNVYSRLTQYSLRTNLTDTIALTDVNLLQAHLDPGGTDIQLIWNRVTKQFSKMNDPNDYIILEASSSAFNNSEDNWTIYFNITFNWTYPNEIAQDVHVFGSSIVFPGLWLNKTGLFQVENDLVFTGNLAVKGEDDRSLSNNDLVCGGELLNFSGLIPVYENTVDVYPLASEFDVTLWDENDNIWTDSPQPGQTFYLDIETPDITDTDGFNYIVNLTGIPAECDKTNRTFTIRLDNSNVTYSQPLPSNTTWQTTSDVNVEVTITDLGGGVVNSSTIMRAVSFDDGVTWDNWVAVTGFNPTQSVDVLDSVTIQDGSDNLVKWQAIDSIGNGPVESDEYRVLVDTEDIVFSKPIPQVGEVATVKLVQVGITIEDNTSGVDATSIEYTLSIDSGSSWSQWYAIDSGQNASLKTIKTNITFLNGTGNRIKWRASDVAGNGPVESNVYPVNVNTWVEQFRSKVSLLTPENQSILATTSVPLNWKLETPGIPSIKYDVLLDTVNPPVNLEEENLTETSVLISGLENEKTYYWTVVPKNETLDGRCISGVWSFSIDVSVPVPAVTLKAPLNGAELDSKKPSLSWDLIYDGNETVTYDVYLWPEGGSLNITKDWAYTQFFPKYDLEDGVTYNWKVVPKAGKIVGSESNTWKFIIKLVQQPPKIDISLSLSKTTVELFPGNNTTITATVQNLGELKDTLKLEYEVPSNKGVQVTIKGGNSQEVDQEDSAEFIIDISVLSTAKNGSVDVKFIATSQNAGVYKMSLEKNKTLTVRIKEKVVQPENSDDGKDDERSYMLEIMVILIVIIIIVILIAFFMLKRKKKREEEFKQEKLGGVGDAKFEPDESVPEQVVTPTHQIIEQPASALGAPVIETTTQVSQELPPGEGETAGTQQQTPEPEQPEGQLPGTQQPSTQQPTLEEPGDGAAQGLPQQTPTPQLPPATEQPTTEPTVQQPAQAPTTEPEVMLPHDEAGTGGQITQPQEATEKQKPTDQNNTNNSQEDTS